MLSAWVSVLITGISALALLVCHIAGLLRVCVWLKMEICLVHFADPVVGFTEVSVLVRLGVC